MRLLHPPWNLLHNILQYGLCTVHQWSGGLLADHKLECAGDVLRECFVGGQVLANTAGIDLLPIVLVFQLKQRYAATVRITLSTLWTVLTGSEH